MTEDDGRLGLTADRAAGLRPQPPAASSRSGIPDARELVDPDEFQGDNAHLRRCIEALLSMDADGALVPHGIGGHARALLIAAYHRIVP